VVLGSDGAPSRDGVPRLAGGRGAAYLDCMALHVDIDRDALAGLCRRHGIRKLGFFGSVLRDDFRRDSDVDVVVAFRDDAHPSLLTLVRARRELSRLLGGRPVDMATAKGLHPLIRARVLRDAIVAYDENG
jgi:uncharacterized protein